MGVGPEKEEVALQKMGKKKKKKRNEKIMMGLVEAISLPSDTTAREFGDNKVELMMDDKGLTRKVDKEKRVESIKESELDAVVDIDIINNNDHVGRKKKKRKLEPNDRNNGLDFISKEETNSLKKKKGGKLKKNECMEWRKENRDKGKGAVSSTSEEICRDKEEGIKETNGLRQSEKKDVSNIKKYGDQHETQEKQKKAKNKKMNGLENFEKNRVTKKLNIQREELGDSEEKDIEYSKEWEQGDEGRKKQEKKDNRVNEPCDTDIPKMKHLDKVSRKGKESVVRTQEFAQEEDYIDRSREEKVKYEKKGRRRGKQQKIHMEGCSREFLTGNLTSDGKAILDHREIAYSEGCPSSSNTKRGREKGMIDDEMEKRDKSNGKRTKLVNDVEEKRANEGTLNTKHRGGSTSDLSKDEAKKSSKRVKFSDHVEVFLLSDATVAGEEHEDQKLVRGKRFSKEEDQVLKDVVNNYIEVHGLGENGLHMVLNCKSFPETRQCWKEIATALPWRPQRAIYWRAHNLFTRGEQRTWTAAEKASIMKSYDENGPIWTTMVKVFDRHRIHIKDVYREMKFPDLKKGHWSQDEYQTLFELVNLDLQMKVHVEKNTKHGMFRDNFSWTAISEKLGTRTSSNCCSKWYRELKSSMVKTGEWDDSDDYRLLDKLLMLDACCVEDVDWDNLINQRSGEACLKRWKQMCLHIGNHGIKPFTEQVEVLAKRYCPNLLEVREALDSRPIVK